MSRLLLTFYGDDFTGSTDALEQLTRAGIRTALFIEPPTPAQLRRLPGLQAVGVAGMTRSLAPAAMVRELKPALLALKKLGAAHVHYKVCSTFDSSPSIGSIGRVMDLAGEIFPAPFIPLLVAAPALGRYTVFGQHFARYGIGSAGAIHRLDRHPAISKHPVTPMTEADLRVHLAAQTRKSVALFDVLRVSQPLAAARADLKALLAGKPDAVLFDALDESHLRTIGALLDAFARPRQPLFSVGSSGIEAALALQFNRARASGRAANVAAAGSVATVLVGSGSCSPVTAGQIDWALRHGFAEVALSATKLAGPSAAAEIERAATAAAARLAAGQSTIIHTTRSGSDRRVASRLRGDTGRILGSALGETLRRTLARHAVPRVCVAGGDTSSFAARALGVQALEMVAPLTPGAPLCRAHAPGSPVDGGEIVFKGGQVGPGNYFQILTRGKV